MENRKQILTRSYVVYVGMCLFAIGILYRICIIQFSEGKEWRAKADAFTTSLVTIEAVRGNIFDVNGALLATSLPYYEIAVDICAPGIDDKLFKAKRDSLATCLSNLFGDKTERQYSRILSKARTAKDRYVVLQRNVSYKDLQVLKTFPIFKKGKRGGLVTLQTNRRERPFQLLAARTIGMSRPGIKPVGLEGAYDSILKGEGGKRLMQKIAGDVWRPINDENEVEPRDGSDLYTTIDINIQDVAEHALEKALIKNQASHGCAVLMEVKTGAIKAIANLSKTKGDSLSYNENLNYAIGFATEPGSTFKLASLLAVMDEYNVSLEEKVNVGNGEVTYYNKTIKDAHPPKKPILSVQEIFETSSNVGVSKIITKYYSKNPQRYVDKIKSFHLNKKLGLSIPGEGNPLIKDVKDKDWSGVTLPQMSYGYETLLTPLQTMALYNAVANDGKMVKPHFVREIKRNGVTTKRFETEVLVEQIVKKETIKKAKQMLEGVVQNGSGKGLNITAFKVGGKTGTAQIAKIGKKGYGTTYGAPGDRDYQASFVGYFPAENPLYTCIVIINSPSNGIYYGGLVAGPVFKEIAEKVYSSSVDFIQPINHKKDLLTKTPGVITTKSNELNGIAKAFFLPVNKTDSDKYVTQYRQDTTKITLLENSIESQLKKGLMPNLTGLSAKDALFLLENHGLSVRIVGFGSVKKQSIDAGQKIGRGNKITLTLS
ncbi:MAG: Peptidoglycan glycosyltransferase [Bacteroidetes bacterium]|nr:Peptidoglycan glycosyltransferase [Bacteroidota bacterium]